MTCERRRPPDWELAKYHERERPPEPPDPGIHLHDGFYLSLGGGGGFTYAAFSSKNVLGAGSLDFAVGGSPVPGVAVGYAMHWLTGADRFMNVAGFLIDVYPDPHGGLHIGITAGWSVLFDDVYSYDYYRPVGWGLAPEVGYDLWIGEQWSAGLTARTLLWLQQEIVSGFSLGLRFLYH